VSVDSTKEWQPFASIYPEDVNRRQTFDLQTTNLESRISGIQAIKFIFEESSDFFGRITVYDLRLEGTVITLGDAGSKASG
jgi:hypothetical protein